MRGPPSRRDKPAEPQPALEGVIADAAELAPGDRLVYPNQGVCRVVGVEVKEVSGQRLEMVRMQREEDGAAVFVPREKVPSVGIRRVASAQQIEGVFHYLGASYDEPELDWKIRHRDNVDRLIAGGILGVAEVVKGLHSLSRIRPLPGKERELYDSSRHLLANEIAVALGVPAGFAEDYVDYALMPPAGVKLALKPPPRPVELPPHPYRRRHLPQREEEGAAAERDLGLEDLGVDLAGIVGGEPEGAAQEGEAAQGEAKEGAAGGAAPARSKPARAPRPGKKARPAKAGRKPAAKPARKATARKKPARKATARGRKKK